MCSTASSPNQPQGIDRLTEHELSWQAEHGEPELAEGSIAALVGCAPASMMRAIHLDDEPSRRSEEVHDEGSDDDLAAKLQAERNRYTEPILMAASDLQGAIASGRS